jgi:hypothetical protein
VDGATAVSGIVASTAAGTAVGVDVVGLFHDPAGPGAVGGDHLPGPVEQPVRVAGVALGEQVGQDADDVVAEFPVVAVGAEAAAVAAVAAPPASASAATSTKMARSRAESR